VFCKTLDLLEKSETQIRGETRTKSVTGKPERRKEKFLGGTPHQKGSTTRMEVTLTKEAAHLAEAYSTGKSATGGGEGGDGVAVGKDGRPRVDSPQGGKPTKGRNQRKETGPEVRMGACVHTVH